LRLVSEETDSSRLV